MSGRSEVRFAILYGSAAEGLAFGDLDVGVFVDRAQVSPDTDLDYALALADELAAIVSFPVDVRVINDAPLPFRYNISRGIPLTVQDYERFYAFLEGAWREYLDFQPIAMQYLRDMS